MGERTQARRGKSPNLTDSIALIPEKYQSSNLCAGILSAYRLVRRLPSVGASSNSKTIEVRNKDEE
jgi:hypothetical protein